MKGPLLIIDADAKYRNELLNNLKADGYEVDCSNNLTKAIKKMLRNNYRCVIMDVFLPEMRGYEAVSIIKSIDPAVKIIIMTAKNTIKLESKVRQQDIYYYFIKSFGLEELKTAIESSLINNEKEKEKMEKEHYKGKILVIDDDSDFVEAISIILKSAFYRVVSASNLKEGKEKLISEKPDLILLDIMMDSLFDGYSFCHALKTADEFKEYRGTPVIFVSAVKELSGSRFSFHSSDQGLVGPDDYIDKPVKTDDLLQRIEKLLKRQHIS
jgi:DNA-binding response OmpR family regulator